MQPIYSHQFVISTYLVNPQKKLGLYGLLNLLQETAWIHATHLGHGHDEMEVDDTAWVLIRQKLRMDLWPKWGETLEIRTWVRPVKSFIAVRDFELFFGGQKIGECSTQWLILDLKTRKPSSKDVTVAEGSFRLDPPSFLEASKIKLLSELGERARFEVRNSDLDMNGHVNNTRYAQWILDSIPFERHGEFNLEEYEVNFIAEAKARDTIVILGHKTSEDFLQFQGVREEDGKTVFAATLKVSAKQLAP